MPQPPEVERLAEQVISLYRESQQRLMTALADALDARQPAPRIRDLLAEVEDQLDSALAGHATWLSESVPVIYEVGGTAMAEALAVRFQWAGVHERAVTELARRDFEQVAATLRDVAADTRRTMRDLLRETVRREILEGIPGGRGSADFLAELQRRTGVLTVRYSNGAHHALADWADTAARTEAAKAHNAGGLTEARVEGVTYMEGLDGADCGLSSHEDPTKANGLIVPIETAEAYPLAHPRCARSWSPRPDVRTDEQASRAQPSAADQARAAAEERDRAATALVDGRPRGTFSVARAGRTARTGRAPREARG